MMKANHEGRKKRVLRIITDVDAQRLRPAQAVELIEDIYLSRRENGVRIKKVL